MNQGNQFLLMNPNFQNDALNGTNNQAKPKGLADSNAA